MRGDELRLDDDDAVAMADLLPDDGLGADAVLSLNRWVDGWPIGLHLTLLSLQGSEDPDADARRVAESEHVLTEYVTGEVIERLAPSERDVALALSVLEWFDVDLCAALVSDGAVPVIRDLQRRGLFLTVIDPRRGAMRFHALFRDLLERELRWRDPAGHQRLHRRAAELWLERGELGQAYRHLTAVGDVDGAHRLVVQPARDLVNRGDLHELRRMALQLPTRGQVEHASLALDLALVMFFAGRPDEAAAWCDHAELLASSYRDGVDDDLALRTHGMRALLALMSADLDAAAHHVGLHQQLVRGPAHDTVRTAVPDPGRPRRARRGQGPRGPCLAGTGRRHHRTTRRRRGHRARRPAVAPPGPAAEPAAHAAHPWAPGRTRRRRRAARDGTRLGNHVLARPVPEFTAVALAGAGRLRGAIELLDGLPDSAQTRLMRARIGAVPDARLADHLADRSTWTIPDQLTADLLIATSLPATAQPSSSQRPDDDASLGVVRRGAETGWVLRLLGHGARTAAHLRSA